MKILWILVFVFSAAVFTNAQNTTLTGSIYAPNGAVIQYVNVKAKSKDGKEYKSISNEDGIYKIELPDGIYTVEFLANLFETLSINNYKIISGYTKEMVLDVALEIESRRKHELITDNEEEGKKEKKIIKKGNIINKQ